MKIFRNYEKIQILDERFYTIDRSVYYPSVTTVLSAYPKGIFFNEWLKREGANADEILKSAGDQGSNVHNAIDSFEKGNAVTWFNDDGINNYSLLEWQMISRYMEFRLQVEKVENTEMVLFSKEHRLGGTLDCVCMIEGQRWLIDFKTSNAIHKTHELQLAIYKEMYEQQEGLKIDRYGVLWLKSATRTDKPPLQGIGWQIKEFTKDHEHNLKLFNHTRALWDEENPNYKPKNLEYKNQYKL